MNLMIALLIVLIAAWMAGALATRLGYPAMLGELCVGILMGPPLLGLIPDYEGLKYLAEVGVFLMMLYIGAEIDPKDMLGASKSAIMAAIGGFIVPFAGGFYATYLILQGVPDLGISPVIAGLFVGMAVSVTSLASKSRILLDLNLLNTRIAMVLMAGALLSDTLALVVFAGVTSFAKEGSINTTLVLIVFGKAVLFFALAILSGLYVFPYVPGILKRLRMTGVPSHLMTVLILGLAYGELAHYLGLHNILGAFMAGLMLRRCVPDRTQYHSVTEPIHTIAIGFLAPVFFVTAGFHFDFSVFGKDLYLLLVVVGVAIAGKVFGTLIFYSASGNSWREGLTIGFGMNGRGAVEIIIAGIGLAQGMINESVYSILVFTAIFTTALVPFTLKLCVDWLESRGDLVHISARKKVVILGAGPFARTVARALVKETPVVLIDRNDEYCRAAEQEGLRVICGNALEAAVLDEAGAEEANLYLALTPNSEINLLAAQYARSHYLIPGNLALVNERKQREFAGVLEKNEIRMPWHRAMHLGDWDRLAANDQVFLETVFLPDKEAVAAFLEAAKDSGSLPLFVQRKGRMDVLSSERLVKPGDTLLVFKRQRDARDFDLFTRILDKSSLVELEGAQDFDAFIAGLSKSVAESLDGDAAQLGKAFREREAQCSTVLIDDFALPHIEVENPNHLSMVLMKCPGGVAFPCEKTVRYAFALVTSADRRRDYLRCLAVIGRLVRLEHFMEVLMRSDLDELRAEILKMEYQVRGSQRMRSESGDTPA